MIGTLSRWLVQIVWFVWILAMLLVGLKIAMDNSQTVQLVLFGWQTPAFSLGFIACIALLFGALLGWFAGMGPYLAARRRARRLEKQLAHARQELTQLRIAPLKG